MLENDQTYFKNLAMLTTQDFKSIFAGFSNCSKKSKRAHPFARINVHAHEFRHASRTRKTQGL